MSGDDLILVTITAKNDDLLDKSCFFADAIPLGFRTMLKMIEQGFTFAHLETDVTHIYFERIVTPRRIVREAILN